jgi:hypothetical protein
VAMGHQMGQRPSNRWSKAALHPLVIAADAGLLSVAGHVTCHSDCLLWRSQPAGMQRLLRVGSAGTADRTADVKPASDVDQFREPANDCLRESASSAAVVIRRL